MNLENGMEKDDDNISINTIKKNTIIKSLKELAEKNDLKIFSSSHSFISLHPIFFLVLFLHDSKTGHLFNT